MALRSEDTPHILPLIRPTFTPPYESDGYLSQTHATHTCAPDCSQHSPWQFIVFSATSAESEHGQRSGAIKTKSPHQREVVITLIEAGFVTPYVTK